MNTNDLGRSLAAALLLGACAFAAENEPVLRDVTAQDERVQRFLERQRGQWHDYNVPEVDGRTLHDLVLEKGFTRALEILDTQPSQCVYVDDLAGNVAAAASVGMRAFLFETAESLSRELESEGLLLRK